MGKFDGILLCTDLDDTLLTTDKRISDGNKQAIEYFKSEGGMFTFATGRVVNGAKMMIQYVSPNVPMICFNGAGIYDFVQDKMIYLKPLGKEAIEVVEFIYNTLPYAAIDVCTADASYFCRTNNILKRHKYLENLKDNYINYQDITDEWVKVIFMTEEEQVDTVRQTIAESEFADKFDFVQSSPWYYEMLPKNSGKGNGLVELARILDVPIEKTIAIGDNYNDLTLIQNAGVGVAVANAVPEIQKAANCITVDNNSDAIRAVIGALDKGSLL